MDTKEQARAKARARIIEMFDKGKCPHVYENENSFEVTENYENGLIRSSKEFPFSNIEQPEQDTYVFALDLKLYLYATGETHKGKVSFYGAGRCSKNDSGERWYTNNFDVIERPTELEKVQTRSMGNCDGCESIYGSEFKEPCVSCTMLVSTPTNFKPKQDK